VFWNDFLYFKFVFHQTSKLKDLSKINFFEMACLTVIVFTLISLFKRMDN
jgi:hypothetical protein